MTAYASDSSLPLSDTNEPFLQDPWTGTRWFGSRRGQLVEGHLHQGRGKYYLGHICRHGRDQGIGIWPESLEVALVDTHVYKNALNHELHEFFRIQVKSLRGDLHVLSSPRTFES